MILPSTVGILPPGALGVAFFHHLTRGPGRDRVFFLDRPGSAASAALRRDGSLHVRGGDAPERRLPIADILRPALPELLAQQALPELILVATNPDQLARVLADVVALLEVLHVQGGLLSAVARGELPVWILAANGIYFQRQRQFFLEQLEEATLLGRLPDLWPDLMPRLVGRLLRGVTIQTGLREEREGRTHYLPGPPGLTRVAGGDPAIRARVLAVLTGLGGWFEDGGAASPTRLEFDKAMINLAGNLVGQLAALDEHGNFRRLSVAEVASPERLPFDP